MNWWKKSSKSSISQLPPYSKGMFESANFHKILRNQEKPFVLSTTSKLVTKIVEIKHFSTGHHHIQKACLKARTFSQNPEKSRKIVRFVNHQQRNWWKKSSKSSISQLTTIFKRPVWKPELSHKTLRNQEKSWKSSISQLTIFKRPVWNPELSHKTLGNQEKLFVLSTNNKGIDDRNRRNQAFLSSSPPYSNVHQHQKNWWKKSWKSKKPWEIKNNCSVCPPPTKQQAKKETQRQGKGGRYLFSKKRTGIFPEAEKKLFDAFRNRRNKGLKVTGRWLKAKMRFIVLKSEARYDPVKHKFADMWLNGFLRRFKISLQRRSNKKNKTVWARIHLVSNFHCYCIYQFATERPEDQHFPESDSEGWESESTSSES